MSDRMTSPITHTHTVRPRWVWIALVVMAAGLILIGISIVATTWAWALPGLLLLVIGGGCGLYGGFFYDVQGGASPGAQLEDVKENAQFEFPDATTKRSEPEVKRDVRRRWLGNRE
jgi:hypothetical protein